MEGAPEIRTAVELRMAAPNELTGYAAVFNSPSRDLGGFTESIRPGAFTRSLTASDGILALHEHDPHKILGRAGSGTLRLAEDQRGLQFSIDLPQTTAGRDVAELVKRGDIAGASFAFTTPKGGDHWSKRDGLPHRELLDVTLHEITITATPAYPDTSVAKRHLQALRPVSLYELTVFLMENEAA